MTTFFRPTRKAPEAVKAAKEAKDSTRQPPSHECQWCKGRGFLVGCYYRTAAHGTTWIDIPALSAHMGLHNGRLEWLPCWSTDEQRVGMAFLALGNMPPWGRIKRTTLDCVCTWIAGHSPSSARNVLPMLAIPGSTDDYWATLLERHNGIPPPPPRQWMDAATSLGRRAYTMGKTPEDLARMAIGS